MDQRSSSKSNNSDPTFSRKNNTEDKQMRLSKALKENIKRRKAVSKKTQAEK